MMTGFDQVGDQFVEYYDTVRGYVRQELVRQNLEIYLPPAPAIIIDIGGGDGRDAAWLAKKGYQVTMVDTSEKMVNKARKRFAQSHVDVAVHRVEPDNIEQYFDGKEFDTVLSHGVLMYCLESPDSHIRTLSTLAKAGAIVSLLTKGYAGALERATLANDIATIRELTEREQCINNLGLRVWAFKPETVSRMLGGWALELLDWKGIRIESDHDRRYINEVEISELQGILATEAELGSSQGSRVKSQMLHFIARKQ